MHVIYLIGFTIGAFLLIRAPGNILRASTKGGGINLDPSFITSNALGVLFSLLQASWKKNIVGFVTGVILLAFTYKNRSIETGRLNFVQFIALFLLISISAIAPFFILIPAIADRCLFYSVFFLTIASSAIPFYFQASFIKLFDKINPFLTQILVPVIGLTLFIFFSVREISRSYHIHSAFTERVNFIKLHETEDVTVKPITLPLPRTVYYVELSQDSNSWVNISMANLYKVKSIKVSP